ncbi:MAG TPA: response regulator, partial [Bacteroidetes bacterium]|nr:response regulator [Bacteroidota bacterium]
MTRRVLLIEDDPGEQDLIAEVLSLRGCRVDKASTGREGLRLLERNFYDLVLCDVKLPDLSGLDVLVKAREHDSDLGVIIITAYPSVPSAVSAIQRGAYDYLQKPLNVDHLEHTLDRYFDYYELVRENRRLRM